MCLWRCIAVARGARPDRSTEAAKRLAGRYFRTPVKNSEETSLDRLDKIEQRLNKDKHLRQWTGIAVYELERKDDNIIWYPKRPAPEKIQNVITVGVFEKHAFLIKDIAKLARKLSCPHCNSRFT